MACILSFEKNRCGLNVGINVFLLCLKISRCSTQLFSTNASPLCSTLLSFFNPSLTVLSRGTFSFSLNHHVASSSNTLCPSWVDRCPIVWLVHLCWEDPCLEQGEPGLNELQMFSLCCHQIWCACAGLHRQDVPGPRVADPADKRHRLLETHSYFPERSQRVQGEYTFIDW